jgi:ketosteroid isomerase-like protein
MSEEARAGHANPPEPEASAAAGPALPAPNFDERSVRRARPAVPLQRAAGRPSTLTWAVVALVAGMCGGLLGILVLNSYHRQQAARPAVGESAPAVAGTDAGAGGAATAATPVGVGVEGGEDGAAGQAEAAAEAAADARGDESAQLRGALADWLAATNARDIERQMEFYDSRVGVFYLTRNASRDTVRAEKAAVIARASSVDVRAGEPQISVSRDGRTATMRFRKQYAIEGAGQERRGAVLQELRWRRTPAGWRITDERDLRVVE